MKKAKRNSLIGLTILTGLIAWSGPGGAAECNSAYSTDSCTFTPDTMRIQLYRIGLCETEPSIGDDTSCQFFVDSTTATEVDLSDGGAFSLPSSGSLSTGTYPFVLLLWDTTFAFSHQFPEFDNELSGANGVTGRFCYSNGNVETVSSMPATSRGLSCASSAEAATAAQAFTQYDLQVVGDDAATTLSGSLLSGGTFDAQLLASDFSSATSTTVEDESSIPGTTLTYATSDAQYFRAVITLTEPVDITASTTSVDIGVDLKNGFELGGGYFNVDSSSALCSGDTEACLNSSSFFNIGFRFTAD